jgi:hypothetical protein
MVHLCPFKVEIKASRNVGNSILLSSSIYAGRYLEK